MLITILLPYVVGKRSSMQKLEKEVRSKVKPLATKVKTSMEKDMSEILLCSHVLDGA